MIIMKRTVLFLFIFLTITFNAQASTLPENKSVFQLGNDKYILNDKEQRMDTISFINNNRVFVPVRYLAYACGIEDKNVLWDQSTQTVTLNLDNKYLQLKVGSKQLIKNGQIVDMDVAPLRISDRVFLPARWIAEAYNLIVEWDQKSKSVLIFPQGGIKPAPPKQAAVLLVNKTHPLPIAYGPVSLEDFEGYQISKSIKNSLQELFMAADKQSISLSVNSGYRDAEIQKQIFDQRVSELGLQAASAAAALPGYSEHQTGLAVDIGDAANGYSWLEVNSWRYGFIQRYPEGSEEITGYSYEPWHFRYVGIPVASFMHENNVQTLEEFIDTYIGE
jgi:D-alanyl-D-alanine carboxypeptidase